MTSAASVLSNAARLWPNELAVVDLGHPGSEKRTLRYSMLCERAKRLASWLVSNNLAPGKSTALFGENSLEFVIAWFGILIAGNTVVPVPANEKTANLAFRLNKAGCTSLLYDEVRGNIAVKAVEASSSNISMFSLGEVIPRSLGYRPISEISSSDQSTAMKIFTSGTTSEPKGVEISHASIETHGVTLSNALRLTSEDRTLAVLPLALSYGCRVGMLATFRVGGTLFLMPKFVPKRALDVFREESISFFSRVSRLTF